MDLLAVLILNTGQDVVGNLCCEGMLMAFIQFAVYQAYQIHFCRAVFLDSFPPACAFAWGYPIPDTGLCIYFYKFLQSNPVQHLYY